MDQGSPGNLGKGVLHHVHHEHSPGKLMGPDHTETVHASESFEKLGLLAAHLAALHDAHMLERGLLPGTQLPDSEAPPIAPVLDEIPWKELKPVTLADMKVGKTHRRHVLQGRLCVTAYKIHSVVSVLEEDSGLATILMLKNSVPLRASMAQAQHCFPEGSRVAIRDPYLTRFPDGLVGVLVEHPTDMVFLSRPMTPEGHWAFTSPKHSESVVHNSSNDTVSQSPDSPPKVASFLVNAGVTQQGDHQKQSSVIVDADMCKRDHHTDAKEVEISFPQDNIVEPQGSAAEDVSTVRDLGAGTCQKDKDVGEVKEIFLPSKDLDEAAQSEPCHVNGDAVTGVPNADIGEAEVVSHPAVEEIKDGGSERENVVEANESGLGDLNRATVGHSDTSNTVEKDKFPLTSMDEVDRHDEEYKDKVGASEMEAEMSDELKGVASNPLMEDCNEIMPSTSVDEGIEHVKHDEESEEKAGPSQMETERCYELKGVVSSLGMEDCNEIMPSKSVDEGIEHVETSKYEKTGEVPKPNRGEAQQEIDLSSMTKESFSAHALRLQGNKLFLHEDFHGATELYTRGILQAMKEQELTRSATSTEKSGVTNGHASESEVLLGFSNRAEAWIRLHEYEKGLEDAEKALALQHDHLKSLFRKGRALLGLHQYHDANLILREAAPRAPLDKDLQAALHESIIRVQQSEMGLFDLSNFYLKGRYVGEFPSCTDYIGPVKVAEVGHGCGRGLVLKKHVEAGELLLVSNPIAFMEVQSFDHQTGVEVSEQSINWKVQEAFGPICANPHALGWDNQKLHMLFDGVKKLPTPPANLLTSNSRCSPVAMAPLDASCIHRIIQLNAFNGNASIGWKNLPGSGDQENKVQNWGLWWLPSFINHSCMPNSSQILVGRALFVFASRELQAGEEITRGYFDIFQPHQQRKDLSTKGWGFVCHCPRCKLEDALHTPLSQVTNHYTQLMELAARPKPEKVSDAKHADNQATTALRFSHELERKLKDLKLRAVEENWIRGSFVHFIDLITSEHELSPHLELVVEAMAAVCPGSESTVHMSVLAKDSAKHTTGKKSVQFKSAHHRAMHICRCTYGKQKSSVLQALVDRDDH
ncbi:unnamed protein product [Sphagnum balticum]